MILFDFKFNCIRPGVLFKSKSNMSNQMIKLHHWYRIFNPSKRLDELPIYRCIDPPSKHKTVQRFNVLCLLGRASFFSWPMLSVTWWIATGLCQWLVGVTHAVYCGGYYGVITVAARVKFILQCKCGWKSGRLILKLTLYHAHLTYFLF